ncbi:MAG TPA: sensor histidine kinase, partial [Cyclobacteriaceae bacterium]
LYIADSAIGNYKQSLGFLKRYMDLRELIFEKNKSRQIEELAIQYETTQKDHELKIKNQSIELLTKQSETQRQQQKAIIAVVVLLVIVIALVYNQYRNKKKSNQILLRQREEIDKQNSSLKHLVEEKEWLVREVHHRVKNNLHMITSLLSSQAYHMQDGAAQRAVMDSQNRIVAMSIVHQKLYIDETISTVAASNYVPDLVNYLKESFDTSEITFAVDIEPILLNAHQSIALGLILNEAITNCIKYAFPEHPGQISISLKQDADRISLVIEDNGIGVKESHIKMHKKSLGMTLMRGLSEELGGEFKVSGVNGTRVETHFSIVDASAEIVHPDFKNDI